jgi:hypothetical protein
LPGRKTLFNFLLSNSKDDNNNPVDTNTNTAIDKSTDHGEANDINPALTLKVKLKMKVKCQNRTIKLQVCMKAGKKNTMHNFQNRKMHVKNGPLIFRMAH